VARRLAVARRRVATMPKSVGSVASVAVCAPWLLFLPGTVDAQDEPPGTAQGEPRCRLICTPELKIELTWTAGDVVGGERFVDKASPWSLSLVMVVPLAPLVP
jgi:hypothetical protein